MKFDQAKQENPAADSINALNRFYSDAVARRIVAARDRSVTKRFVIEMVGRRVHKLVDSTLDRGLEAIFKFVGTYVAFCATVGIILLLYYALHDDALRSTLYLGLTCFLPFLLVFFLVYCAIKYEAAVCSSPLTADETRALYGIPLTDRCTDHELKANRPIRLKHVAQEIAENAGIQRPSNDERVAQAQRRALES